MPLSGTLKQLKWQILHYGTLSIYLHTHTHPLAARWRTAHRRRAGSGRRLGPDPARGVSMVVESLSRFLVYFGG